jgi:kumamolisin
MEKFSNYIQLDDTYKTGVTGVTREPCDPERIIKVTITLRLQRSVDEALEQGLRFTREEFDELFAIPDAHYKLVDEFAMHCGLKVDTVGKARRSVVLSGMIKDFERAFRVKLYDKQTSSGQAYRDREGYIQVPAELYSITEGVLGLDDVPASRPSHIVMPHAQQGYKSLKPYTPLQVAKAYGFPEDADGTGQCIALIELGGGYRDVDMEMYFGALGIPLPDIKWLGVDGAFNAPTVANTYDREVAMNIQVAGAIAPGSRLVAYFAPNTDSGFLNAITTALHDKVNRPDIISISWGAAECKWTARSLQMYNEVFKIAALLGVTVCCASGNFGVCDNVKDGQYHVDFPSASPYVLSCGGTSLLISGEVIVSEMAWLAGHNCGGGGGVSEYFARPYYQEHAGVPASKNPSGFAGRGVPDVAGNADPMTGYQVVAHGMQLVVCGTSSVAPLYAGLLARINQLQGISAGFINPHLYSNPQLCRNIGRANNHSGVVPVYKPGKGWDACTGLGVLYRL